MSSPTQSTQTEGPFHGSSEYAAAVDVQDTAISVAGVLVMPENLVVEATTSASGVHVMPGSIATVSSKYPNAAFQKSQSQGHLRSVSPII